MGAELHPESSYNRSSTELHKVYDCYSPEPDTNVTKIVKMIYKKNKEQAKRIVINLDESSGEKVEQVIREITKKATPQGDLKDLKELLIVKDNKIKKFNFQSVE